MPDFLIPLLAGTSPFRPDGLWGGEGDEVFIAARLPNLAGYAELAGQSRL